MSQTFTIVGTGLAPLVTLLGNENPPMEVIGPARPAPDVNWQVQTVMPLDALTGHAIALGNGVAAIEWTVVRTHENKVKAQMFVRDHPALIPCVDICTLIWELNGTLASSKGAIQSLTWEKDKMPGPRTVCTYRWVGSLFLPASLGGNS